MYHLSRSQSSLKKLNPKLTFETLELTIQKFSRDRSLMSMVNANQEIYKLLKDGVKVRFLNRDGKEALETVKAIDGNEPRNNDFLPASQLSISGEMHKRYTNLIGFVNRNPLLFIELKASHRNVKNVCDAELRVEVLTYREGDVYLLVLLYGLRSQLAHPFL